MSYDTKRDTFDSPLHREQKEAFDHVEESKEPINEGMHQVRDVRLTLSGPTGCLLTLQGTLYEALKESEIQRWSRTSLHMYVAVFIGFLCSCANGYDGSLFSGILSMPYFQSTFGSGTEGSKVSLIASLYTV